MCNFVCLVPHKSSQTLPCIPEGLQKLKSNKEWLNCRAPKNYRQLQGHNFICNEHKRNNWKEMWNWWCSQYQAPQSTPFNSSNSLSSAFNLWHRGSDGIAMCFTCQKFRFLYLSLSHPLDWMCFKLYDVSLPVFQNLGHINVRWNPNSHHLCASRLAPLLLWTFQVALPHFILSKEKAQSYAFGAQTLGPFLCMWGMGGGGKIPAL